MFSNKHNLSAGKLLRSFYGVEGKIQDYVNGKGEYNFTWQNKALSGTWI